MSTRIAFDVASYHFDPADPDLIRNPYEPYYRVLREQPGLHQAATSYLVAARHADVREVITNYERYRKGTLEFFCEIFGVPSPKTGITGKNVAEYFKAGKLDEIAKYCLGDCKATGQLFQKLKNYYR